MKHVSPKGFTLIELLVVVAIVGVFASILFRAVGGARISAADATIKSSLDSISISAQNYYDEHNKRFTDSDAGNILGSSSCPAIFDPKIPSMLSSVSIFSALETAMIQANGSKIGDSSQVGIKNYSTRCYINSGVDNEWVISVPLRSNPKQAYCIDSNGGRHIVTTGGTAQTTPSRCGPKV